MTPDRDYCIKQAESARNRARVLAEVAEAARMTGNETAAGMADEKRAHALEAAAEWTRKAEAAS